LLGTVKRVLGKKKKKKCQRKKKFKDGKGEIGTQGPVLK